MKKLLEDNDPIVRIYTSDGSANGRPIREGTFGGIYYECPNSFIKSYLRGKRLLSCKFFDGRHKYFYKFL